jgi:hypothetical protein
VRCWVLRERAGLPSLVGVGLLVVSSWAGLVHTVTRVVVVGGLGFAGGGFVV